MQDALGTLNFRDVGGIPVRDGQLRTGHVYRSEGPASFDARHREALGSLGFRVVCDLRSAFEQQNSPNDWADGARLLNFDIIADLRAKNDAVWSNIHANPTIEGARQTMVHTYRAIPAALQKHYPLLVTALTKGETPVLVHCTAGKDRTGVLVALLLKLLGASDEDILKDYLRSECYGRRTSTSASMRARFAETMGFSPDDALVMALIGVDPSYLAAAFDTVNATWGSVEDYFEAAGIDDAARGELARALVEGEVQ